MTVTLISGAPNSETQNAEALKHQLLESEPGLSHPDVEMNILCGLFLPEREIDLVVLFHDRRPGEQQFKTSTGASVHSFVLVLEVKNHSPDLVLFEGVKTLVRYGRTWHDASAQCSDQTYALKRFQETPHEGTSRRQSTFVQRAIWLKRAPSNAFSSLPSKGSVPVHFANLSWQGLIDGLKLNRLVVRTLADEPSDKYHSLSTLRDLLTFKIQATRLDLKRVNALTKTRFDAEKTAYIQNLGSGLLILRGRGGTGKTFALVQIALHLAKQGKRTAIVTFNHGLLADLTRAFALMRRYFDPSVQMPTLKTRFAYIRDTFVLNFGDEANAKIYGEPNVDAQEKLRLEQLLDAEAPLQSAYDYVLVDEGQDWDDQQRDLLFKIHGAEHLVVADGVDQFVANHRCTWDNGKVPINRRHSLRASRRTKASTCQTVAEIARELGVDSWDLVPDPESFGGRFTVLVEPNPRRAIERGLNLLDADQESETDLKPVDNLVCMPSEATSAGINFPNLFDAVIKEQGRDSWRGFEKIDRRTYPQRNAQIRAVQYHSCRGMEGWSTLCLGLDRFFDYQNQNPRLNKEMIEQALREKEGFFFSEGLLAQQLDQEARRFAINWLMIPLTRSIDHLVVHLTDENSALGKVLKSVNDANSGTVEWIRPPQRGRSDRVADLSGANRHSYASTSMPINFDRSGEGAEPALEGKKN